MARLAVIEATHDHPMQGLFPNHHIRGDQFNLLSSIKLKRKILVGN